MRNCIVICLAVAGGLMAQTRVDLRNQARNVDFSTATATKPFKTGAVLPATCSVGEAFFKSDAPAGENLYTCTAANVWSPQASLDSTVARTTGANVFTGANSFSAATRTAPNRTGTGIPSSNCALGDTYFRTDAIAGSNLYLCTSTDTWTAQSGGVLPPGCTSSSAGRIACTGTMTAASFATADSKLNFGGDPTPDASINTPATGKITCWNSLEGKTVKCKNDTGAIVAAGRIPPTATDPGCRLQGETGNIWIDNTTPTNQVYKVCLNVSGMIGWITK